MASEKMGVCACRGGGWGGAFLLTPSSEGSSQGTVLTLYCCGPFCLSKGSQSLGHQWGGESMDPSHQGNLRLPGCL